MTMRIFIGFAQVPEKETSALVVLNPAESKRVLAKATVALPEVQNAWKNGMIIIARGITSAFVTGEFFGTSMESKAGQTVGLVAWAALKDQCTSVWRRMSRGWRRPSSWLSP